MATAADFVRIHGDYSTKAEAFFKEVGLADGDILERIARISGDAPFALRGLPEFKDAPAQCFRVGESGYGGDYPRSESLPSKSLKAVCSFEIGDEEAEVLERVTEVPPWLSGGDQEEVFDELLGKGDLLGAWMTLNSTGWYYHRAKDALQRLAVHSPDPTFHAMVDAWMTQPSDVVGAY